jgi:hypothetical protein
LWRDTSHVLRGDAPASGDEAVVVSSDALQQ